MRQQLEVDSKSEFDVMVKFGQTCSGDAVETALHAVVLDKLVAGINIETKLLLYCKTDTCRKTHSNATLVNASIVQFCVLGAERDAVAQLNGGERSHTVAKEMTAEIKEYRNLRERARGIVKI